MTTALDRTATSAGDQPDLIVTSMLDVLPLVHVGLVLTDEDPTLTPESKSKLIGLLKQKGAAKVSLQWLNDRQSQFTPSGCRVLREFYRALGALTEAGALAESLKQLECELSLAATAVCEVAQARQLLTFHEKPRLGQHQS